MVSLQLQDAHEAWHMVYFTSNTTVTLSQTVQLSIMCPVTHGWSLGPLPIDTLWQSTLASFDASVEQCDEWKLIKAGVEEIRRNPYCTVQQRRSANDEWRVNSVPS